MKAFQNIIKESLNNIDKDIDNNQNILKKWFLPFKFEATKDKSSEFEIVIIIDYNEYRYGFEYDSETIIEEWMYKKSFNTNRTSIIFERSGNNIYFGPSVRKDCKKYSELVPKETLVLSLFNKLNIKPEIFKDLYLRIMDTLVAQNNAFEYENDFIKNALISAIDDNKTKDKLLAFLESIESGIKDISYEKLENGFIFKTTHVDSNKDEYELNLDLESEGTIKSIILFLFIDTAILNNMSLFVDELNIKLHPLLLKFIIDLFHTENTEAQLIYTTHDTTLMDKKFFRRDQIFFVEKDEFWHNQIVQINLGLLQQSSGEV